jgi:hypothetical protein
MRQYRLKREGALGVSFSPSTTPKELRSLWLTLKPLPSAEGQAVVSEPLLAIKKRFKVLSNEMDHRLAQDQIIPTGSPNVASAIAIHAQTRFTVSRGNFLKELQEFRRDLALHNHTVTNVAPVLYGRHGYAG